MNEVVQFFVCCTTFVLSVGLLLATRSCFFFQALSLSTPCEKYEFFRSLRMFKFESTSSGVRVGIRVGVWVSRCAGVRVCW